MTYYDRLNEFFRRIEHEPLNASAQLVFLHLLHFNNLKNNKGEFYLTDRRLIDATRLNQDTITQAKRQLKNKGFIDFATDKKNPCAGTLYKLPKNAES